MEKGLRIGNLMIDADERICRVERLSIDTSENRISAINWSVTVSPIKPIVLNNEWLEKLGFEWSECLGLYGLENSHEITGIDDFEDEEDALNYFIHFYHDTEHIIVKSTNEHGEYCNLKFGKLKYVHELQNLYFAMTGEELTVKL